MPLVIADTSPIIDLILIEHIDLLPRLFQALSTASFRATMRRPPFSAGLRILQLGLK